MISQSTVVAAVSAGYSTDICYNMKLGVKAGIKILPRILTINLHYLPISYGQN